MLTPNDSCDSPRNLCKSKNTISYYAVFDGHGGPACAAFVTRQLHVIMARHPDIDRGSHFMRRVITESFTECQELWRREVLRSAGALSEGSGCTGAVAIVYNRRLFIAWGMLVVFACEGTGRAERRSTYSTFTQPT